uniref:Uncharacterized protein n=1 Tax=Kalanchoe fedtschenkoi TaxID=63787 RepID=A0A7N0VB49_KALFE
MRMRRGRLSLFISRIFKRNITTPHCNFPSPQPSSKLSRFLSSTTQVEPEAEASVRAVEKLLQYEFKDKTLLQEALTHPSCPHQPTNYQRLEFIGDAALACAVSTYLFAAHPLLAPAELTLLRAANVSTERLARVAVRHHFYKHLRHNAPEIHHKVKEFALAVLDEKDNAIYGGAVKAPKVLADIVESVAAAIYIDNNYSVQHLWQVFQGILEPTITYEDLRKQPQPMTTLYELCQKEGKQVDFKRCRKGAKNISNVFVGGKFIASSHLQQKETAKLSAAKGALEKLEQAAIYHELTQKYKGFQEACEIDGAKQKLLELCGKNNWPKPSFRVEKKNGPTHDRRFVCVIHIKTNNGQLLMEGNRKSQVRAAENSAASLMLLRLKDGL